MAKKASPNQAIDTTSPKESCLILLNVLIDRQIAELGESEWVLGQYVQALRKANVPRYALAEALTGRITTEDEARIALLTSRLLGTEVDVEMKQQKLSGKQLMHGLNYGSRKRLPTPSKM